MRAHVGLAQQVIELATRLERRIAVAESLTGGLVTAALVAVPGASHVLSGGIVSYDTELKHTLLGVDRDLLDEEGPVCEEVALQMAAGVRRACAVTVDGEPQPADVGVATTGVAGPDADPQTGQEPGTVWLAVSGPGGDEAIEFRFSGSRDEIRNAAVQECLHLLLLNLSQDDASFV